MNSTWFGGANSSFACSKITFSNEFCNNESYINKSRIKDTLVMCCEMAVA
jgi:hypothetical protein